MSNTGQLSSGGIDLTIGRNANNPDFKAQIDITVRQLYSNITLNSTNVTTSVALIEDVEDVEASFKTPKPFVLFGQADLNSAYANALRKVQIQGGSLIEVYTVTSRDKIYTLESGVWPNTGNGEYNFSSLAVANKTAKIGDIVIAYLSDYRSEPFGAGDLVIKQVCEIVISCRDVQLATLTASTNSDTFAISGVRYSVDNILKIAQFENVIEVIYQSLFGKVTNDSINPLAQFTAQQYQTHIIDIPLVLKINKNVSLASMVNYDVEKFTWSLFILDIKKLQ